jgi:hypothetical protein
VTEICRHLQEFSPDIHVVVPNSELEDEDVRTRISADDYGNLHCKGKYCRNAVRREITNMSTIIADILLLTTKVAVAHEVAHIEYSTFSDAPAVDLELVHGQDVGISAKVALTDGKGEVVAVFCRDANVHHLVLAGNYDEHYITMSQNTEDDLMDLSHIAKGQ